jgi:hypothetical protein
MASNSRLVAPVNPALWTILGQQQKEWRPQFQALPVM